MKHKFNNLIIALLVCFAYAMPAWGDIAHVVSANGQDDPTSTTCTVTIDPTAASRTKMMISGGVDTATTIDSATWKGSAVGITHILTKSHSVASTVSRMWYLDNPSDGSGDVVITFSNDNGGTVCSVTVLSGAAEGAPEASNSEEGSTSSDVTNNITTIADNAMVIDAVSGANSGGNYTADGDQVERTVIKNPGDLTFSSSTEAQATPGSVNMGWTSDVSDSWVSIAASIAPFVVEGGGGGTRKVYFFR